MLKTNSSREIDYPADRHNVSRATHVPATNNWISQATRRDPPTRSVGSPLWEYRRRFYVRCVSSRSRRLTRRGDWLDRQFGAERV